jgi:hypothetical protein
MQAMMRFKQCSNEGGQDDGGTVQSLHLSWQGRQRACMHAHFVCECNFILHLVNEFLRCTRMDAPCLRACSLLCCELFQFDLVYMAVFYLIWIGAFWLDQCVCTDLMFHITHEDAFTQVHTNASRDHVIHVLLW